MKLHPALRFYQLQNQAVITAFHASEVPDLKPSNHKPLHVGSVQQAEALIKNMQRKDFSLNFYLYEVKVKLNGMAPFFHDEDPKNYMGFPLVAYKNRIEFPQGTKLGDNISISIFDSEKQVIDLKMLQ